MMSFTTCFDYLCYTFQKCSFVRPAISSARPVIVSAPVRYVMVFKVVLLEKMNYNVVRDYNTLY